MIQPKTLFCTLLIAGCLGANAQQAFNFDFEKTEAGKPMGWQNFGNEAYTLSIDTINAQHGKNAAVIEYSGGAANFKAWAYTIPANFPGEKIKLSGYLKTENVSDGWAGLWLRIDPQVGFDNMQSRGIIGTTGWEKYEIELDLQPDKAQQIVFGGLLAGKGKMWLDNLELSIDGERLENMKPRELLPAEKDTAFNAGSGIRFPPLDEKLTGDLELLGKIWGLLKYHHPEVAKGNYNWDFELFRFLPDYLKNKNREERDRIVLKWIDSYGKIPECKSCPDISPDAFLKPDHAWIGESNMSKALKQKLQFIQKNRHQGKQYYIGMAAQIGNPEFNHEEPYANMPYPDEGYRLLAVYKYWNMIHYFFPNKHLTDKPWDKVLKEHIAAFIQAQNELEYERAAIRMIGDIQDTHANLWGGNNAVNDSRGKYYPPVHVWFIENKLVVTDYYNPELKEKTGLEIGDVITKINGKSIGEIIGELKPYYPASNDAARLRDIATDILRSNDRELQIGFVRNQAAEETKKLALYERDSLRIYRWYRRGDEKSYKMLDGNIGYITLKSIKDEDVAAIRDTFKNTKGIIIDIRNYPSAFVPFALGSFFIDENTPFVKFSNGDVNTPGQFIFTQPLEIPPQGDTYAGKVVVIVNEITQSSAEYTSMAFRAGNNTTVIGSTTAGADGNVSTIFLPGGLRTMISGIGVYYPDGKDTQRVGIVPDIEVKPTVEGVRLGKDEVLQKAIELIEKG